MRALEEEIVSLRNIPVERDQQLLELNSSLEHSEKTSKKKTLKIEQLTKVTKG